MIQVKQVTKYQAQCRFRFKALDGGRYLVCDWTQEHDSEKGAWQDLRLHVMKDHEVSSEVFYSFTGIELGR